MRREKVLRKVETRCSLPQQPFPQVCTTQTSGLHFFIYYSIAMSFYGKLYEWLVHIFLMG